MFIAVKESIFHTKFSNDLAMSDNNGDDNKNDGRLHYRTKNLDMIKPNKPLITKRAFIQMILDPINSIIT